MKTVKALGAATVNGTKSWKTTLAGVVAFLSVAMPQIQLLFDNNEATQPDWNIVVTAGALMLGLLFSRDNDKRSETVGA